MSNPNKQEGVKEESEVPGKASIFETVKAIIYEARSVWRTEKQEKAGIDKFVAKLVGIACGVSEIRAIKEADEPEALAASQPRGEDQEKLWTEVFETIRDSWTPLNPLKSKFTITRKEKGEAK